MVLRAALEKLIFEFKHNFSGKSFQSLLLLTANGFSAASTPTRVYRLGLILIEISNEKFKCAMLYFFIQTLKYVL
jgi:hypothetical protein